MLRSVREPARKTFATCQNRARWCPQTWGQCVRNDEKRAAPAVTHGAVPVTLRAAARALLPLDLNLDLGATDDQRHRLARDPSGWRAGDLPRHIVDGTPAMPVRSLFQTDALALRMLLRAAWGMRASHVAWTTNVNWP